MKRSSLAAITLVAMVSPALAASGNGNAEAGLDLIACLVAIYFFPSIIAMFRRHHNTLAIFLFNLFLGWSVLGWVGALVWAATQVQRRADPDYIRIRRDEY